MSINNNGFKSNRNYKNNYVDVEKKSNNKSNKKEFPQAKIENDIFVAISDTNFCSTLEQQYYSDFVLNYVTKNGITDIVHTGNLLQGMVEPYIESYDSIHRQVNHVLDLFPEDIDVTTHILLGSNDKHALKRQPEMYKLLESHKGFNIMGYKKAYIEWGKYLFSAFHYIPKTRANSPYYETEFNLCGAGHSLNIEGTSIFVPPLSMDVRNTYGGNLYPGFLVIRKNDKDIIFNYHAFIEKQYIVDTKEVEANPNAKATDMGTVLTLSPRRSKK